jgi:hypothetical protein
MTLKWVRPRIQILIGLFILLLTLFTLPTFAAGTAELGLVPSSNDIRPGDVFTVTVEVQAGINEVNGAEVHLDFDPTLLAVTDLIPGTTLPVPVGANPLTFDNNTGTVGYSAGLFGTTVAGTFDLLTIEFEALSAGSSPLDFVEEFPRDSKIVGSNIDISVPENPDGTVTIEPREGEPATLALNPSVSEVEVGDIFSVVVEVQAGTNEVNGAEVHLDFDPTLLAVTDLIPGTTLPVPVGANPLTFDNNTGTVGYSAGLFGTTVAGTFDLLTIEFEALSAGSSPLDFVEEFPRDSKIVGSNIDISVPENPDGTVTIEPREGEPATLALNPSVSEVEVGDIFSVVVEVQAGTNEVNGAEVHLDFDPTLLAVTDLIPGTTLSVPVGANPLTFDNNTGTVGYSAGLFGTTVTGTFDLLTIEFEALSAGGSLLDFVEEFPRDSKIVGSNIDISVPENPSGIVTVTLTPLPVYTLSTDVVGAGQVSLDPAGGSYDEGTTVTLTASADAGWEFEGWSGDVTSSDTPVEVIMDSDKTVTATFIDVEAPQFTECPADISIATAPGADSVVVSWDEPVATDNDGTPGVAQTEGPASGSSFSEGETVVVYTATDAAGNETLCSFTVTVTLTPLPVYTLTTGVIGEGEITLNPAGGSYDEGTTVELTATADAGWEFEGWSGDVTSSDNPVNVLMDSDKTVTATFIDVEAPQFTECPADISIATAPGAESVVVTWDEPVATDNDGTPGVAQTEGPASGSSFSEGETVVVYTATDAAGNETLCSFTVTVTLTPLPVYTLTTGVIGEGEITLNPPGGSYDEGTTVELTATADAGWELEGWSGDVTSSDNPVEVLMDSDKTVTATFIDVEAPQFTECPADISIATAPGAESVVVTWDEPVATDNDGTPGVAQTEGPASGSSFSEGETVVVYTATDAAGNETLCSFTVTVTLTPLPVYTLTTGVIGEGEITLNPAGGSYDEGTTVELTATADAGWEFEGWSGDVTSSDNPVNVLMDSDKTVTATFIDVEAPQFTECPADISIATAPGAESVVVTWDEPVATDNDGTPGVAQTEGPASGSSFSEGETVVVYTATDAAGNETLCSFTVTVTLTPLPVYTLTTGVIGEGEITLNPAGGSYDEGTTVELTATADAGWEFEGWSGDVTSSDNPVNVLMDSDKTVTATFIDVEAPQFTECPADISIATAPGAESVVVTWDEPVATDNDGTPGVAQTEGPASGSSFSEGETVVVYTATDAAGNETLCSFTVTVTLTPLPVYTLTTGVIGEGEITLNPAGGSYDEGTTVELTATADAGWEFEGWSGDVTSSDNPVEVLMDSDKTVTATFIDVEAPQFTECPADISIATAPGAESVVVTWDEPVATDNDGTPGVAQTEGPASGSSFSEGETMVEYTATDAAGNETLCSFTVTVTLTPLPVYTLSTDVVGAGQVSLDPAGGSYDEGTTVELTATADAGWEFEGWSGDVTSSDNPVNVLMDSDKTVTATFIDVEAPQFTECPADINIATAPGAESVVVTWDEPVATDNDGTPGVAQTEGPASGSSFSEGETSGGLHGN